jgi:hypothetical protein
MFGGANLRGAGAHTRQLDTMARWRSRFVNQCSNCSNLGFNSSQALHASGITIRKRPQPQLLEVTDPEDALAQHHGEGRLVPHLRRSMVRTKLRSDVNGYALQASRDQNGFAGYRPARRAPGEDGRGAVCRYFTRDSHTARVGGHELKEPLRDGNRRPTNPVPNGQSHCLQQGQIRRHGPRVIAAKRSASSRFCRSSCLALRRR